MNWATVFETLWFDIRGAIVCVATIEPGCTAGLEFRWARRRRSADLLAILLLSRLVLYDYF